MLEHAAVLLATSAGAFGDERHQLLHWRACVGSWYFRAVLGHPTTPVTRTLFLHKMRDLNLRVQPPKSCKEHLPRLLPSGGPLISRTASIMCFTL